MALVTRGTTVNTHTRLSLALTACALLLTSLPATAQYDDEDIGGYAVVIQNRKFDMGSEFTLQLGVLPLDAFYKGITGSGRYTLHLTDFHAWEIGAGTFSFNIETDLRRQLRENFAVQPDQRGLEQIYGYVETNYVIKPIYGKSSLFNRFLIYNELYFTIGGAIGIWTDLSVRPGPGYGAGIRFFILDWLSIRFDMRHYVLLNGLLFIDPNARLENLLYVGGGVSFNFFSPLFG
jgi:outer membrane beta-barrel protein